MSACAWCAKESDVLIPMTVDMGGTPFHPDLSEEEWCPECCADLIADETYAIEEG